MASTLESFSKWLQLKIYQLEVTMSVYIYTPIEKFIFYSVLFLLFSLTFIATVLYLPQHLQFIVSRAWFYMHGDLDGGFTKGAIDVAAATTAAVGEALSSIAAASAERVKEL